MLYIFCAEIRADTDLFSQLGAGSLLGHQSGTSNRASAIHYHVRFEDLH